MLCTVGDLVEDVVVWMPRAPRRGTDTPSRVDRARGGSAANVAVFAAAIGLPSRFVGQVGDDALGAQLVTELRRHHVDVVTRHEGRTGSIVVLVTPDGERTMLSDRGAATALAAVHPSVLEGVTALHVPAYSLTVDPLAAATLALLGEATSRGIAITVDASSVAVLEEFGTEEFVGLLEHIRPLVLFCNRDEATALGVGSQAPAPGVTHTVIKAGAGPTTVVRSDGVTQRVPVRPVAHIVDTTGAGDAFAAGYLRALLAEHGPTVCAEAGHVVAARVLARPGASLAPVAGVRTEPPTRPSTRPSTEPLASVPTLEGSA
jgi:sugar/nucleoside kinase (ribokinase family)